MLHDLDRLPSIGYYIIARESSPLIVHGSELAERIRSATGVRTEVVSFVAYNVPSLDTIDESARSAARDTLGFTSDTVHVATFGIVDRRTKGTDLIVSALSWLRTWKLPAHLHIVGPLPDEERTALESVIRELGADVTLHGRVAPNDLETFLLAVDVAGQLRMSAMVSLSGALADCIAYGVPTVTTQELIDELDAPSYVGSTGSAVSSLLVAEAIDQLHERRRNGLAAIETERRDYLARRSVDAYARGVLRALG